MLRLAALAAGALAAPPAMAVTLDFTQFGSTAEAPTFRLPLAVVTNLSDANVLTGVGSPNGICALTPTRTCAGDLEVDFTRAVTDLTFAVPRTEDGDRVDLSVFGADDATLLGSVRIDMAGLVDLTAFGAVGRLFLDDGSTLAGQGVAYLDFTFDVVPVPLPASLPLLAAGLGLLALRRRA